MQDQKFFIYIFLTIHHIKNVSNIEKRRTEYDLQFNQYFVLSVITEKIYEILIELHIK